MRHLLKINLSADLKIKLLFYLVKYTDPPIHAYLLQYSALATIDMFLVFHIISFTVTGSVTFQTTPIFYLTHGSIVNLKYTLSKER